MAQTVITPAPAAPAVDMPTIEERRARWNRALQPDTMNKRVAILREMRDDPDHNPSAPEEPVDQLTLEERPGGVAKTPLAGTTTQSRGTRGPGQHTGQFERTGYYGNGS
jgi:hypothetical protein